MLKLSPSAALPVVAVALFAALSTASTAHAARPINIYHEESGYTGPDYFSNTSYTRGYDVTVVRDMTITGISLWGDFPSDASCTPRVYDDAGALRAEGDAVAGDGTGSALAAHWWRLPIDTEVYAGEDVVFAVHCAGSGMANSYHPHRDPPATNPSAAYYFTGATNLSFFGDGYPNVLNSWWGDWRIEVEQHGLFAEKRSMSGNAAQTGARGARLTPTRGLSITGMDFALDLGVGESCWPQIYDGAGVMIAEGTLPVGDGSGIRWYRSDVAAYLAPGLLYTVAVYCPQATPFESWWNSPLTYETAGDATSVNGRSGGGDGVVPVTANAITPFMQVREGEVEFVERDGVTDSPSSSNWSEWTWGWRFTPDVDMTLLGIDVLNQRNAGTAKPRLYETATGTLLASSDTSIPNDPDLEWRSASLPPILLSAGTEYTVALFYSGGGGSTPAPFYGGTSGSTSRPGVISNVTHCASGAAVDVMPTSCSYNKRVERMRIDLPEPGFASLSALGAAALAGLARRRARCAADRRDA